MQVNCDSIGEKFNTEDVVFVGTVDEIGVFLDKITNQHSDASNLYDQEVIQTQARLRRVLSSIKRIL